MPPRRSSALQCFSFSKSTNNKLSINQLQMTTLLLHWCLIRKKNLDELKIWKIVLFHKYDEVWRFLARSFYQAKIFEHFFSLQFVAHLLLIFVVYMSSYPESLRRFFVVGYSYILFLLYVDDKHCKERRKI